MGKSAVQEILNRIKKLPDADRAMLESKLAQRAEAQWQREATIARRLARQREIDQAAIDRAVAQFRYPSRRPAR